MIMGRKEMAEQRCHSKIINPWMWMVLAMIATVSGCGAAAVAEPVSSASTPTGIVRVQQHDFPLQFPWFGRVESSQAVDLVARTSGRIMAIKVADEASVQSGTELIELGGAVVTARRAGLTKQVEFAAKSARSAKQSLAIRQQMLGEHLSNKESLNAARQVLAQAQSRLSATRQALAVFKAAIRIKAPINGVLTGRRVHPGQYVTSGAVLARIINPRRVRIRASLFPPQAMDVAGMSATVHSGTGQEKQAMVSRVMPERTAEGAVQVWIEGDALTGLAPGMQVSGAIVKKHAALAVPERAIAMDDQEREFVFIKDVQEWRKQRVETGLHEKGWVEIISGLKEGDQVATEDVYEMLYQDFSKIYRSPD